MNAYDGGNYHMKKSILSSIAILLMGVVIFFACGGHKSENGQPNYEGISTIEVGRLDIPLSSIYESTYDANRLYLPISNGFLIINLEDLSSPNLITHFTLVKSRDIIVSDGLLYNASWNSLDIVDISNPMSPGILSTLQLNSGAGWAVISIALSGNNVFITGGGPWLGDFPTLSSIDVSDPLNPILIDESSESGGADVFIVDSIAYVTSYDKGLRIFDISDPSNIQLIGVIGTVGSAAKVRVLNNLAYVLNIDGSFSLTIIDISDPSAPSLISNLPIPDELFGPEYYIGGSDIDGFDMEISGNYAYLCGWRGVAIVDVSDITSPKISDTIGPDVFTSGIELIDNHVIISNRKGIVILKPFTYGDQSIEDGQPSYEEMPTMEVGRLDIPLDLVNLGSIFGEYLHEPTLDGNKLYVPTGTMGNGFLSIDLKNPASPSLVTHFTSIKSRDIVVSDGLLYSVSGNCFDIVDITNPTSPEIVSTLELNPSSGAAAASIALTGNIAFITGGGPWLGDFPALSSIDVSDPLNPILLDGSSESGGADVFIEDSIAYVASYKDGLQIYDISVPSNLRFIGATGTIGSAANVEVANDVAYVLNTGGSFSLTIINITDPSMPSIISNLPISRELIEPEFGYHDATFFGMKKSGNYLYLCGWLGVVIVDVSDNTSPKILGVIGPDEFTSGIELIENYIVVVNRTGIVILKL